MVKYPETIWGVTVEFTTRYKQPIPLAEDLRVIGRISKDSNRFFEGTGEILLSDGSIAAKGHGKYLKFPIEKIADFDVEEQEWKVIPFDGDPTEVEI